MMLRWAVNCTQWMPTKQEWCSALCCLQREEVERIGRFVYRKDSKLALVGRVLIRAGLCVLLDLSNNTIHLTRSEKGKPLLVTEDVDDCLGFNISHQGAYCVFAAQSGSQVGVDVMEFTRPRGASVSEFFHTMRRQFTKVEWDQIESGQTHTHQLNNFYRFWCLKESFIKAEGTGLSYGLQNLEFIADNSSSWPPDSLSEVYCGSKLYVGGKYMSGWSFSESLIDRQHCVAVATQSPNERGQEVFTHLTVTDLLEKIAHRQQSDWTIENADILWTEFNAKTESPVVVTR